MAVASDYIGVRTLESDDHPHDKSETTPRSKSTSGHGLEPFDYLAPLTGALAETEVERVDPFPRIPRESAGMD